MVLFSTLLIASAPIVLAITKALELGVPPAFSKLIRRERKGIPPSYSLCGEEEGLWLIRV